MIYILSRYCVRLFPNNITISYKLKPLLYCIGNGIDMISYLLIMVQGKPVDVKLNTFATK